VANLEAVPRDSSRNIIVCLHPVSPKHKPHSAVKSKVSKNTTSFVGVKETTSFGLFGGHHQVCKFLRD